jgi:hypothetical protein
MPSAPRLWLAALVHDREEHPPERFAHLARGLQSPSFAAGIRRNFCFIRNRPLLGPHSES